MSSVNQVVSTRDTIFQVCKHLDTPDLGRCCQVNKLWQQMASSDPLWQDFFFNLF
jgi:hypothetical protein